MLGYDNQKQWYQSVENLDVYFLEKKIDLSLTILLKYC